MSASLPPAPAAMLARPASARARAVLWSMVAAAVACAAVAVAVDVVGGRAGGTTAAPARLLVAVSMLLAGSAGATAALERRRRCLPRRAWAFGVTAAGLALFYLTQAALYLVTAESAGAVPAWFEDVALLVSAPVLAVGLIVITWPPGMSKLQAFDAVIDSAVAGIGLLVVWLLYVVPGQQPAGTAVEERCIAIDVWLQWLCLVVVVFIAAASRRTGALPVRQLILLQLAVVVYLASDIAGDTVVSADRGGSISYSILGYTVAIGCFVACATRPALEPETPASALWRDLWAIGVPLLAILSSLLLVLAYRVSNGAFPASSVYLLITLLTLLIVVGVIGRWRNDRTERRLVALAVEVPLEQATRSTWFPALLGESRDVVTVVDRDGLIVYQSPSVRLMLGVDGAQMRGRSFAEVLGDGDAATITRLLLRVSHRHGDRGPHELVLVDVHGVQHITESSIVPLREGSAEGFVITTRDVTDRRRLRAQLSAAGSRDALTGLSSREAFLERLREVLPASEPGSLAVLVLDLAHFRDVNDARGQEVGDHVLRSVAGALDRLPGSVAAVARLAGDEFAALVVAAPLDAEVAAIDRELREALSPVLVPDGSTLHVDFELGYTTLDHRSTTASELLEQADLALRSARSSGRRLVRFSATLRSGLVARLQAEVELRGALDEDRIVVEYQPVLRLTDSVMVGFEALVRLRALDGSLVPPSEFIPLAEELGLIDRLGQRVLDVALRDAGLLWAAADRELTMAVNASVSQLTPAFVVRLRALLAEREFPASAVVIEVTESALAESPDQVVIVLGELRDLGVRIALDDFGTGYSSLAYLAGLPVDEVKIDRSFVAQLGTSSTSLTLARTVVQLARALDLTTVAEGVETVEQADLLRGMGCLLGQGFLFSRPRSVEALLEEIASHRVPPVPGARVAERFPLASHERIHRSDDW